MSRCLGLVALLACLGMVSCIPPEWVEDVQTAPAVSSQERRAAPIPSHAIAAGSISLAVRSGWQRTVLTGAPGVTLLRPEGVDDSAVQLAIPPGEELRGDGGDWVAERWRALPYAKNNEQMQRGSTSSGESWLMLAARLQTRLEGLKPVVLQVLSDGVRVQPLFWYFRDEEGLGRYSTDVEVISQSVQFLPPQERPASQEVILETLVPRTCVVCAHTFTGAPPTTPAYLVGTWASGTLGSVSGPQY
jgi:hypothetical protein